MDGLAAGVLLATFFLAQGDLTGPVGPHVQCPMLFCPMPKANCTLKEPNYIVIRGRQCLGCPECEEPQQKGKRDVIHKPIDLNKLRLCPIVDCAYPGFCTNYKTTTFEVNGIKCPGCPVCPDTSLPLGKRNVIPIDLEHLVKCPLVDCAITADCNPFLHSTYEWHGRQCKGCPVCAGKLTPREVLPVLHLDMCPMILCAAPGPCDQPYKMSTTMFNGKKCGGCAYCPKSTEEKREILPNRPALCPMVKCRAPGPCDHDYNYSYAMFDGVRCPMCPFCDKKGDKPERDVINPGLIHLDICPIPMCAAPGPCDHAYSTSYMTVGKMKCPMCPYCDKNTKREEVPMPSKSTCPHLPCPLIMNCEEQKTTMYNFNEVMCPGCPVCVKSSRP